MRFSIEAFAVWRATAETPKPDISFVPPMERRRLTGVERAALATAWQARSEGEIPVVFASRWGEVGVTVKLMQQFHADGEMSPAGFSASVHNAAPGVFSLLTKNHAPYTAIAARDRSLEAGLLETLVQNRETLFVYAEEATPAFYEPEFGPLQGACSVAVRVRPDAAGPYTATFAHADAAPLTFDDWVAFLQDASTPARLQTAHMLLTRG